MQRGERFNTITHLLGVTAASAGISVLIVFASLQSDPWKIVSFSVYGASLFLLYLSSTLYHSMPDGKAKNFFKKMDHHSIYLLIAGTYTPFALITLRGPWGWTIFGIVWGLAVVGIFLDSFPSIVKEHRILPLVIYLLMGWIGLAAVKPMIDVFPLPGSLLILAGGIFYTAGVFFYVFDDRIRHFHGIWHLFVLAGSICHYLSIVLYVA